MKDGQEIKLVKLRNPWGDTEWVGDWSDNSDLWTEEIKQQIRDKDILVEEAEEDGIFWMSFDDFKKFFDDFDMNKYNDDHKFANVTVLDNSSGYHLVKMTTKEKGIQTVAVTQFCERMMQRSSNYKYSLVRFIVFKATDPNNLLRGCEFIKGVGGQKRDEYIELNDLEAGEYFVFVQMEWDESSTCLEKKEISISCYGQGDVTFSNEMSD